MDALQAEPESATVETEADEEQTQEMPEEPSISEEEQD